MKTYIAYYRVSTKDQNLGIEAQKEIVKNTMSLIGGNIIASYEEHMSGKCNTRPELAKALAECKQTGATLVVAKVDRLTRVASFGLYLCERNNILFCDHPTMGTLEQAIYFGMAQQEREYISQRTKAALAVKKAQGIKLGNPNAAEVMREARGKGLEARRANTKQNESNRKAYAVISIMQGTWADKAAYLNANGFLTAKGGEWRGNQVKRLAEAMAMA